MTFGLVNHQFGHLYPLFQTYWNFVTRYHSRLLPINHFIILSWRVYEKLKNEWLEWKWDIAELDWICTALDRKCSMLIHKILLISQLHILIMQKLVFF